jgi:UDP-N-acetylmuramate--alanine ligase
MFPLAQILHERGYYLTGSDNNPSSIVEMERALGIPVTIGQCAKNIEGADLIVYTAAILPDNPELVAAKQSGIPTIERAILLGIVNNSHNCSICVSGTHGKTTTSSMLTQILLHAKFDPSAVIGGKLKTVGAYGIVGKSEYMVTEACEFKDHFLQLRPAVAVVLNIDCDHMEYFKTLDNLKHSFETFMSYATRAIILNGDDANSVETANRLGRAYTTFGRSDSCDFQVTNPKQLQGVNQSFTLLHHGKPLGEITLQVPGAHNQLNAAAAVAAAMEIGVSFADCAAGLAEFTGSGRRFEILAQINGITIADDYAHHPAEIAATLSAAKSLPFKRVWAVHQPFTYSRTQLLLQDFAKALQLADRVTLTEIMGSREKKEDFNVCSADLAALIPGCAWYDSFDAVADAVASEAKEGDLIITLGCGDVYKAAQKIIDRLQ